MNAQLKPEPSLFTGEPVEVYHAKRLGEVSAGALKRLLRSPLHYRHWLREPEADTPALVFGRAFHCALFEPERFREAYVVHPGDDAPRKPSITQREAKKPSEGTIEAIAYWDAWNAEHGHKVMISTDDLERIEAMIAAVHAHPWAKLLIRGGEAEASLRWIDPETGLSCKLRADYYVEAQKRWVVDAKSCADASPEEFGRAVHKYGYHLSHAHYVEGFKAAGKPLDNYFLLAVESEAPHAVMVYAIDAAAEAKGYELRARGMARMRDCLAADKWPAYSTDIVPLALPPWAVKTAEEGTNA